MNHTIKSPNPWPIAIFAFFIVFATFLATFVVWALGQRQDLVTENYYEQELRYQEQLDRLNRTQAQSGQSTVTFDATRNCIVIKLPAAQAAGASGKIQLYRPSNARLDHEVPLAIDAGGVQTLDAKAMAAGLWKVRLQWSVNGQEYYFDQAVVVTGAPISKSARSSNTAFNSPNWSSALL
jgi:hypothetical protein